MEVIFTPTFLKQFNKLTPSLQDEVVDRVELFKDKNNHVKLKVHALHGKFNDLYSFSVNYSYRVVFEYTSKKKVLLLKVGNHDMYK